MPKGTCPAEAMSNNEKIKPVTLVVAKLRLCEGIRQLVSQAVSRKLHEKIFFKNSVATY